MSNRKWITSAGHDGTKSSGIPFMHIFIHSTKTICQALIQALGR